MPNPMDPAKVIAMEDAGLYTSAEDFMPKLPLFKPALVDVNQFYVVVDYANLPPRLNPTSQTPVTTLTLRWWAIPAQITGDPKKDSQSGSPLKTPPRTRPLESAGSRGIVGGARRIRGSTRAGA